MCCRHQNRRNIKEDFSTQCPTTQEGSPGPTWPSCLQFQSKPGWHYFRGLLLPLCSTDRTLLQGHLREGIVLFIRWEEKIKFPCCFLFGMKRRKTALLFLISKAFSERFAFKGRKGSVEAELQSRLSFSHMLKNLISHQSKPKFLKPKT